MIRNRQLRGLPFPPARLLALALAGLLAGSAAPLAAKDISRDYHESFDVTRGDRLVLHHDDGDVKVTAWDQDVLDVEVRYRATIKRVGVGTDPDLAFDAERDGDRIRIRVRETGSTNVAVLMVSDVKEFVIDVKAPAWLDLELRGDDGDVTIDAWTGDLSVQVSDGDIQMRRCRSARTRIQTDDGDIDVGECRGHLEIRGDDGDVEVALLPDDGIDVDIRVADGTVRLRLPPDLSAECLVRTDDGAVRTDLPGASRVEISEEAAYVVYGQGSGKIRIETEDGDVILRER